MDLIVAGEFGVVYKGYLLKGERKITTGVVAIKTLKGSYYFETLSIHNLQSKPTTICLYILSHCPAKRWHCGYCGTNVSIGFGHSYMYTTSHVFASSMIDSEEEGNCKRRKLKAETENWNGNGKLKLEQGRHILCARRSALLDGMSLSLAHQRPLPSGGLNL